MFYFWTDVTATLTDTAVKLANCNHCGEQYSYMLERTARASAHAPFMLFQDSAGKKAYREAAKKLRRELQNAVDPVPCPNCACYPAPMAREIQRHRLTWLWTLTTVLALVTATPTLLYLILVTIGRLMQDDQHFPLSLDELGVLVGVIAAPLCFYALRRAIVRSLDPNSDRSLAKRRQVAARRATSLSPVRS